MKIEALDELMDQPTTNYFHQIIARLQFEHLIFISFYESVYENLWYKMKIPKYH